MPNYFILVFFLIAVTTVQSAKKSKEAYTNTGLLGVAKSLIIGFINENSDLGHVLLNHVEKCPFYCLNDGKKLFIIFDQQLNLKLVSK